MPTAKAMAPITRMVTFLETALLFAKPRILSRRKRIPAHIMRIAITDIQEIVTPPGRAGIKQTPSPTSIAPLSPESVKKALAPMKERIIIPKPPAKRAKAMNQFNKESGLMTEQHNKTPITK